MEINNSEISNESINSMYLKNTYVDENASGNDY